LRLTLTRRAVLQAATAGVTGMGVTAPTYAGIGFIGSSPVGRGLLKVQASGIEIR
jgi:hypothetical protein